VRPAPANPSSWKRSACYWEDARPPISCDAIRRGAHALAKSSADELPRIYAQSIYDVLAAISSAGDFEVRLPAPLAEEAVEHHVALQDRPPVREARVATSPGVGFGPGGEGFVRFALPCRRAAGIGSVDPALASLHKHPAQAWTLEDLARSAGTSRSVLAERFQDLVGTSPMQYLTQWRMMLAANLLRHSNTPLAHIAEGVGYQTDTAFIRAFRREFGAPPAAWRRSQVKRDQAL